jgi:hypothetical protein
MNFDAGILADWPPPQNWMQLDGDPEFRRLLGDLGPLRCAMCPEPATTIRFIHVKHAVPFWCQLCDLVEAHPSWDTGSSYRLIDYGAAARWDRLAGRWTEVPRHPRHPGWPHATPEQIARLNDAPGGRQCPLCRRPAGSYLMFDRPGWSPVKQFCCAEWQAHPELTPSPQFIKLGVIASRDSDDGPWV